MILEFLIYINQSWLEYKTKYKNIRPNESAHLD